MKISELEILLKELKEKHGDLEVCRADSFVYASRAKPWVAHKYINIGTDEEPRYELKEAVFI